MKVTAVNKNKSIKVNPIANKQSANLQPVDEHLIKLINGHSPIISDHKTWLVYNDETQQYEDTNVIVNGEETDPTVPLWAKEQTKPSYTPDEIGAVKTDDALSLEEIESMFGGVNL